MQQFIPLASIIWLPHSNSLQQIVYVSFIDILSGLNLELVSTIIITVICLAFAVTFFFVVVYSFPQILLEHSCVRHLAKVLDVCLQRRLTHHTLMSGKTHSMWNEWPQPRNTFRRGLCLVHLSKSHFLWYKRLELKSKLFLLNFPQYFITWTVKIYFRNY